MAGLGGREPWLAATRAATATRFYRRAEEVPNDGSLSEAVHERLRLALVRGEYRPNQRLIETELAEALGVSRTPVREALQRLEVDGLIVRSRQGWVVYEHGPDEIGEIYEVRAALEAHAAWLAAAKLTEDDRTELERLTGDLSSLAELPATEIVATNEEFHRMVLQLCRNARLKELSESTRLYYFNYRLAASYSLEELRESRRQHREIAQALLQGDGDRATALVREHIQTALDVALVKLGFARDRGEISQYEPIRGGLAPDPL